MSNNKKDLTRIEDLGEFLHELQTEEESIVDSNEETPELPAFDESSELNFSSEDPSQELEFTTEASEETPPFEESEDTFENTDPEFTTETFESPNFESEEESETSFESFDKVPEDENFIQESSFTSPYKAPENFEEVRKFAESSSLGMSTAEASPSFSILLKNIKYIEDANDILTLLKELKVMSDAEEQVKARLLRGNLLIPRVSEYAAIFIAHKLRRFDIDIEVGLSDEIHPPKHQESADVGIVSKFNLFQNQTHHFEFDDSRLDFSQIIVAATPTLEGYQVVKYLGIASEHKIIDQQIVEDEFSAEIPEHYSELAQRLKAHALKARANAVVGLNYQLTPLPSELGLSSHKYRVTCTGNLVWVNKV